MANREAKERNRANKGKTGPLTKRRRIKRGGIKRSVKISTGRKKSG